MTNTKLYSTSLTLDSMAEILSHAPDQETAEAQVLQNPRNRLRLALLCLEDSELYAETEEAENIKTTTHKDMILSSQQAKRLDIQCQHATENLKKLGITLEQARQINIKELICLHLQTTV